MALPSAPARGGGGQGGGQNPDEMRNQMVQVIGQMKSVAESNGLDFDDILAEASGSKANSDIPSIASPPPAPGKQAPPGRAGINPRPAPAVPGATRPPR